MCVSAGVTVGGDPACYIVEHHLSRFVEGQVGGAVWAGLGWLEHDFPGFFLALALYTTAGPTQRRTDVGSNVQELSELREEGTSNVNTHTHSHTHTHTHTHTRMHTHTAKQ